MGQHRPASPVHRVASATVRAAAAVGAVILLADYGSKACDEGKVRSGNRCGAGATGPGGLAATAAASRGDTRRAVAVDCSVGSGPRALEAAALIQLTPQMRLLLAVEPVDFRKGIAGLVAVCRQRLATDPLTGALFVLSNRRRQALKLLVYDGQGFGLAQKRLSAGRFNWWPSPGEQPTLVLDVHQLQLRLWNGNPAGAQAAPMWRPITPVLPVGHDANRPGRAPGRLHAMGTDGQSRRRHGRRQFVDIAQNFPAECRHVLESLAEVYKHDAQAKDAGLSPEARLRFHQEHSQPVMDQLHQWMNDQLEQKRVEPNSGLGQALGYMRNHWGPLTLFLRQAGAPLDNNICERALKMAILHRKNSLGYKTPNGARLGDLYMSLIHTCRLCAGNPLDYLNAVVRHAKEAREHPTRWFPWNYKQARPTDDTG